MTKKIPVLTILCFLFVSTCWPSMSTGATQLAQSMPSSNREETAAQSTLFNQTPDISLIIEKYRQEIPDRMKTENVPGLAIAVVDGEGVLWAEGFGYSDWNRKVKVTPDTLFSIQSMSKSFTGTAAMFAAQDGLVDLDAPISTYLPDFRINSIFEEHPEQKITLRMLLSHTAGLAQEAPRGGNFDRPTPTFDQHIASISDTWLMFPVGTRYSYSNLGIDLAGYILQVRSGEPFIQYVEEKVLKPLGMSGSTLDFDRVHATSTRAIGHNPLYLGLLSPLSEWAIIPSGGVWTTANDMACYLRFHINSGSLDGAQLLREDLAETMYTSPNEAARQAGYGLGIATSRAIGARELQHGGGGFGFNSNMVWYPDLKLGAVALTNSEHENLYGQILGDIIGAIIRSHYSLYHERDANASPVKPALAPTSLVLPLSDSKLAKLIQAHALPTDAAAIQRRETYEGTYIFCRWGIPVSSVQLKVDGGQLSVSGIGQAGNPVEVKPGLFFDPQGNAVDLRGKVPMATNIRLVKVNEPARIARIIFYSLCAFLFISTLLYWPILALIRRRRQKKGLPFSRPGRMIGWAGLLGGLAGFLGLACLVIIGLLPGLLAVPWPAPYPELIWWQFIVMSMPYIALTLAVGAATLTTLAWVRNQDGRGSRIYYTLVALFLVVFNVAVLI